jgi:hypothetical protein
VADGGGGEEPRRTRVFISCAHESEAHAESARDLWIFPRANGVDARLDSDLSTAMLLAQSADAHQLLTVYTDRVQAAN